jgi:protein-tyrosine phosphatase
VHPRDLDWEGLLNVRDLGGHPIAGGGETRFGAYVRADNVERLTDAGWQALVDYGVHTVVDLRYESERQVDPPADLPITSIHRPLVPDLHAEGRETINALTLTLEPPESTRAVYLEFLSRYRDRFGEAVTSIASADGGGAVLFHCMGGKDRTGLIAALLLSLAGVERDAIAADYAVSAGNLRPMLDAWIDAAEDDGDRVLRTRISASPAEAMLGVLDALDERYGGAENYLCGAGVADDLCERVRDRLRR